MLLILIYNTNDTIIQYHKSTDKIRKIELQNFHYCLTMSYYQDTKLYVHVRTTV